MEALDASMTRARDADGTVSPETLARIEREWIARADRARTTRYVLGSALLAGAAATGAVSAWTALAPRTENQSNSMRVPVTAALAATAVSLAAAGASTLVQETRVESSLRAYRAGSSRVANGVQIGPPSVSVGSDGVGVAVGGRF
jgi:hypothetical protein